MRAPSFGRIGRGIRASSFCHSRQSDDGGDDGATHGIPSVLREERGHLTYVVPGLGTVAGAPLGAGLAGPPSTEFTAPSVQSEPAVPTVPVVPSMPLVPAPPSGEPNPASSLRNVKSAPRAHGVSWPPEERTSSDGGQEEVPVAQRASRGTAASLLPGVSEAGSAAAAAGVFSGGRRMPGLRRSSAEDLECVSAYARAKARPPCEGPSADAPGAASSAPRKRHGALPFKSSTGNSLTGLNTLEHDLEAEGKADPVGGSFRSGSRKVSFIPKTKSEGPEQLAASAAGGHSVRDSDRATGDSAEEHISFRAGGAAAALAAGGHRRVHPPAAAIVGGGRIGLLQTAINTSRAAMDGVGGALSAVASGPSQRKSVIAPGTHGDGGLLAPRKPLDAALTGSLASHKSIGISTIDGLSSRKPAAAIPAPAPAPAAAPPVDRKPGQQPPPRNESPPRPAAVLTGRPSAPRTSDSGTLRAPDDSQYSSRWQTSKPAGADSSSPRKRRSSMELFSPRAPSLGPGAPQVVPGSSLASNGSATGGGPSPQRRTGISARTASGSSERLIGAGEGLPDGSSARNPHGSLGGGASGRTSLPPLERVGEATSAAAAAAAAAATAAIAAAGGDSWKDPERGSSVGFVITFSGAGRKSGGRKQRGSVATPSVASGAQQNPAAILAAAAAHVAGGVGSSSANELCPAPPGGAADQPLSPQGRGGGVVGPRAHAQRVPSWEPPLSPPPTTEPVPVILPRIGKSGSRTIPPPGHSPAVGNSGAGVSEDSRRRTGPPAASGGGGAGLVPPASTAATQPPQQSAKDAAANYMSVVAAAAAAAANAGRPPAHAPPAVASDTTAAGGQPPQPRQDPAQRVTARRGSLVDRVADRVGAAFDKITSVIGNNRKGVT